MTAYVGMDLHRRRSLAVCLDEAGERLWWRRFENSPQSMAEVVADFTPARDRSAGPSEAPLEPAMLGQAHRRGEPE